MDSILLTIAAAMTFLIGFGHSWLGEKILIGPLLDPEKRQGMLAKDRFARQVIRFGWHATSIAWWGLGAVVFILSRGPISETGHTILLALTGTFLATGLGILISTRGRHFAWLVFLIIAALTGWVAI